MNIFGVGLPEMAVIAAVGLLVFGPKKLPEIGRSLGKTLKGLQSASRQFEQEFSKAIDADAAPGPGQDTSQASSGEDNAAAPDA
ncbi:MAG: TatA/E family twin arginine-targeting protein translocase [Aphanocapsa feldmannii 277cV]|uniref:Sec-independent protein translocase protein TatA n=2 Tax=Aphanocapsa feldmannii TaxID=192050 RepID=A0A524RPI6_9CHRO|nr:MAG: TatA/E family twin arginine-targeting protein translocase [Aphanocapsa feldmannii 288cV]TGG93722.1 MAG: TatA/E family twin arginine-targeting protein translocase [Aphanocapsa feldmannii 277cV]TGH18379.1 MAG: TatA/E family twin arginine-targeting protein translocase [Aphanocapsa feldmannii 277cI]